MRDQGCMLRAYSRRVVDLIVSTQETSTFIPALAYSYAANPTEVEVEHAARAAGTSKYSLYKLIRLQLRSDDRFLHRAVAAVHAVRHGVVGALRLVRGVSVHPPARDRPRGRGCISRCLRSSISSWPSAFWASASSASTSAASTRKSAAARVSLFARSWKSWMAEPAVVVFAYHDVGYVCLRRTFCAGGARVVALITHEDDPNENRWFRSVAELAQKHGIPVYKPESVNNEEWITRTRALRPRGYFFVLLPSPHPRDDPEASAPGRVQPARFAAAKIPWARTDQLGDHPRRNPNRRHAASHGGQAGCRRHRRPGGRTDRANGNRARGVRQGRGRGAPGRCPPVGQHQVWQGPAHAAGPGAGQLLWRAQSPKTAASTGAWAPGRFSTSCVPSPTRTRARLRNSTDAGFLSGGRCHDVKPRTRLIL